MKLGAERSAGAPRGGGIGTISRGAPSRSGGLESSRPISPNLSNLRITSYIAPRPEGFSFGVFKNAHRSFARSANDASVGSSSLFKTTGRTFGPSAGIGERARAETSAIKKPIISENRHGVHRRRSPRGTHAEHSFKPRSYDRIHKSLDLEALTPRLSRPLSDTNFNRRLEIGIVSKLEIPEIPYLNKAPKTWERNAVGSESRSTAARQKGLSADTALVLLAEIQNKREELGFKENADAVPTQVHAESSEHVAAGTKQETARKTLINPARMPLQARFKEKLQAVKSVVKTMTFIVPKSKAEISTVTAVQTQAETKAKIKKMLKATDELDIFVANKTGIKPPNEEAPDETEPELDVNATRERNKLILWLRSEVLSRFKSSKRTPTWHHVAKRMPPSPDKRTISELVAEKGRDGSYSLVRNKLSRAKDIFSTKIVDYLLSTIRAVRIRPKARQKVTSEDVRTVLSDIPSIFGKKK